MAVILSPIYNATQLFDNLGKPLAGGKLYSYQAGSVSVQRPTYTTSSGTTANANPIVLDSSGRVPFEIWLDTTISYQLVLTMPDGTTVLTASDNIGAVSGSGGVSSIIAGSGITVSSATGNVTVSASQVTFSEWISGPLPTYLSPTSFSLLGNQATIFNVGRRIRAVNASAAIVYGTIVESTYASVTTVTVNFDDAQMDSTLASISYGLLSGQNTSSPSVFGTTPVVLASATTVNIGAAASTTIDITGSSTITSFDNVLSGVIRNVRFGSALTITYNATSMILPGSTDLVIAANDNCTFLSLGNGNWCLTNYDPAQGLVTPSMLTASSVNTNHFNEFLTNNTWVAPTGVTTVYLSGAGGGGGGGGGGGWSYGNYGGGAGGGGELCANFPVTVVPGTSYSIVVGTGGSGGSAGVSDGVGGPGSIGVTTTFALTATPFTVLKSLAAGSGGSGSVLSPAAGGKGGRGNFNGNDSVSTGTTVNPGANAPSMGGGIGVANAAGGIGLPNTGGGGAGGCGNSSSGHAGYAGGVGGSGYLKIEW